MAWSGRREFERTATPSLCARLQLARRGAKLAVSNTGGRLFISAMRRLMNFKFSLRIALLLLTYATLVSAALIQMSVAAAYFIWIITWGAMIYALLLAICARGRTKIAAMGSLLAMSAAIAATYFTPNVSPGVVISQSLGIERGSLSRVRPILEEQARVRKSTVQWSTNPVYAELDAALKGSVRTATAEAISLQLLGIAGAVVGAKAFRHASEA
jgi:hypothetical protein